MIKKASLLFVAVAALLLSPVAAFADEPMPEQEVQAVIASYFELRYNILSTLEFNDGIKSCLAPGISSAEEAISEADVLDTIVSYRKNQINDLRFDRYQYEILYKGLDVSGDTAWALFDESSELYHNCAPTVPNNSVVEHIMTLKKYDGKWLIVKDDYIDPDGVKKALSKYFLEGGATIEEAKKKVLLEPGSHISAKISQLQEIMKYAADQVQFVFFAGKPVAYACGAASILDGENTAPLRAGGEVLLPLRYVAGKLGAAISWDSAAGAAEITYEGGTVAIKPGEPSISVNGAHEPLHTPARLAGGRLLVPAEVLERVFSLPVYQDEEGLVIVSKNGFDRSGNEELVKQLHTYFNTLFTKSDFPKIDGSTATYPLSIEIGKKILGLDETGAKGFITHNTTHNAYVNLIGRKADIIFVTQPSAEEYDLAAANGVELEVVPICREGFVFLVNGQNSVNTLTAEQIRAIYLGKITNWREVGGTDDAIIPYQREANSGSQTIMENTVMQGLKLMDPPKEVLVYGMGQLIDRVADYSNARNALGYSVYYYATTMYQNRNVKLIAVDAVAPDKQTIRDGSYPFTVGYYAVLRKDEPGDSSARRLLKWLLDVEGQHIVDQSGFVPL